jgi:hypothetical protein
MKDEGDGTREPRAPPSFSLSGTALGCDPRLVEPRTDAFVAAYLTPSEQSIVVAAGDGDERALMANLVWCGKESALKVLRTGLRRDTRSVEVSFPGGEPFDGWAPVSMHAVEGTVFPGWWKRFGAFVLTVAATEPFAPHARSSIRPASPPQCRRTPGCPSGPEARPTGSSAGRSEAGSSAARPPGGARVLPPCSVRGPQASLQVKGQVAATCCARGHPVEGWRRACPTSDLGRQGGHAMKSQLTVDDALDQAVAAMGEGARPWSMGPAAARRVRDAYRPDFEIQFRRPGAWERESGKVLRLARWAGAVAALLAETEAGPGVEPGDVPPDHAFVGTLAARHACPIPASRRGGAVVAGRWCNTPMSEVPTDLLRKAATLFTAD